MRQNILTAIAVSGAMLIATSVTAQQMPGQPDAAKGAELTAKLCSNCHVDDPKAPRLHGTADVPTFVEIARIDGQSVERITGKMIMPAHPMPAITLSRDQMADIARYILSLK